MTRKERAAKVIRVATVPPVMVLALLLVLFFRCTGIFSAPRELLWSILLLAVLPLLAYPLSSLVPGYRRRGREGQRDLALVLSPVCYAGAVLYGFAAGVSRGLFFIFLVYLLSALVLIVFNKVLGLRASGHACSLVGPMLLSLRFLGVISILPCLLLLGAILWSSLVLGRHTPKELALGALSTALAFFLSTLLPA